MVLGERFYQMSNDQHIHHPTNWEHQAEQTHGP